MEKIIVAENWNYQRNCLKCGEPCLKTNVKNRFGVKKDFCGRCYLGSPHQLKYNSNFSKDDFCKYCRINEENYQESTKFTTEMNSLHAR